MAGLGSMYAIAEMNQRTEEMALEVRNELFRIGCAPGKLSVERRGPFLVLTYRSQTIYADPYEVLIVVRKIPSGLGETEVWEQVRKKVRRAQSQRPQLSCWAIVFIVSVIVLSVLLFIAAVI